MLYYIPREGEDINNAEVVVPELDTIIEMKGDNPQEKYVEDIVFDGIEFAYSELESLRRLTARMVMLQFRVQLYLMHLVLKISMMILSIVHTTFRQRQSMLILPVMLSS